MRKILVSLLFALLPLVGIAATGGGMPIGPPLNQYNTGRALWPLSTNESGGGLTWANICKPFYAPGNLLRYCGADSTGVADSTSALQSAVNGNVNGTIYIPAGTYKVSAVTGLNHVTVVGDGPYATTLSESSATGDMLTVSASSVTISGIGFTSSVTRTAGSFVNFTAASSLVTLRDFYMTNHFIGVRLTCGAYCRVQFGLMVGGATTAGSTGILVDGGNDQYINQVTMDAPAGAQPNSGIQITNTGALNITDCDIIHHSNDLWINPQSGVVASVWVENTYFDTAVRGIVVNPGGTGSVVRLRFVGTWGSSHSQQGTLLQADGTSTIDGIEFIGHHAINNGGPGILLQNSSGTLKNIRIVGGFYGNNVTQGVAVGAGVSEFSIIGARLGSGFGVAGNTSQGIAIIAGASNNYVIKGNDVRGNTIAGISDLGTGTAKYVSENLGYSNGAATITVGASPFSYTNNNAFPVAVIINNGTVSQITINSGASVGTATNTSVVVPQGQTLVVTYSVAPTMQYIPVM